jgi:segregation and condensation protein B
MDDNEIKYFIEAALLAAGRPMSVDQLQNLFDGRSVPEKAQIRQAVSNLLDDYENRGITISEVASGYRVQVKKSMAERLEKLWEERSPRYSRALFETLALIAYRQPMTRGEIEEIRGVSVSTNIMRSLLEREWIRVVGHRDVPGRPAMFGTTKLFLDYFGLKQLDDLPPLADLSDWESLRVQLNLPAVDEDDEELPTGEVTELPGLHPEGEEADSTEDSEELPVLEPESEADPSLEPIQATEWPDPKDTAVILKAELAGSDEDAADDREDVDASLTGV